ncbi:MAG: hypothetical protein EOM25_10790 [Deltaproteobacteria bacterium]|nr:hypothetical protein [Deltaproteobacteria bacterium]
MMIRATVVFLVLGFLSPVPMAWCCEQCRSATTATAVPYHEEALFNYYLARRYQAEGRYELAREKLVLALAIARNEEFRAQCLSELQRTEDMIYAKRLQIQR